VPGSRKDAPPGLANVVFATEARIGVPTIIAAKVIMV
jgi:hypothetical protein